MRSFKTSGWPLPSPIKSQAHCNYARIDRTPLPWLMREMFHVTSGTSHVSAIFFTVPPLHAQCAHQTANCQGNKLLAYQMGWFMTNSVHWRIAQHQCLVNKIISRQQRSAVCLSIPTSSRLQTTSLPFFWAHSHIICSGCLVFAVGD